MMKKIAIPTRDCMVDDHFGHCAYYTVVTLDEQNQVLNQERLDSPEGCGCKSKSIEKVTKTDREMPDWFRNGTEAALLAPTAINQQKFRFILHGEEEVELRSGIGFYSKVDKGIVRLHFEIGAGINNFHWKV